MKELNVVQMEEISGGEYAVCAAYGFVLGVSIGTGFAIGAMGAVIGGYLNGCY